METGDNAEAVDPEETNLNKTELIVERDGEKEKNNPSEKAEYGTDEKQDNNEDDEMSPSSRNLRSVKKPDIKKIENSANSKDTTTFKPKLVVSKAKKVTKSIKNRKSEDRLLVKLPVHNKDSTETDKSRSPKKRSLNLFKKKSELDQSSSPQDDDVPLATLQKKIRADSHCDTKDDEEESLIPVVEPCTPKKASPEKVEFTPSKEEMLEKVGLTPTKSLSETVLSPRRASIQEMLHDWQKKITPNTRSKQKKLEELMKSPLTPPRRRSLFKSPTKNTENLDRKGIENDEKSNCKASEYEEKPNAESEDPLPPSVAVPQSDQHVDIEQRPSDIAPVLTCRVDVTDTTVEKSSTHKKKKKHKHKHRHERSKDKGSKENDSENGDVKKPKERHSADGSVTSGGSHHKKHKHKHRHREKTGEDGHKHKHRDSGEHRHSHKKKKRKREESPGVEAKRPKLEGDISQESLADLNVDEVLSKLYNS
ncbi:hypothetical protein MAR_019412 [Mya arenaria]|uniref:Uncharacterized protein n=1 Tax=Mya arenaria TaxID=6604 RepID=A0ABY7EM43_MYAAR|nr:hypothetical protein MAR_019412 [Mya arenaria]